MRIIAFIAGLVIGAVVLSSSAASPAGGQGTTSRAAQSDGATETFSSLAGAVQKLSTVAVNRDKAFKDAVQSLTKKLQDLRLKRAERPDIVLSDVYLQSLGADATALGKAAETDDASKALVLIKNATDDLAVKLTFANKSAGVTGGLGGTVTVTVNTKHDGAVVNGYTINANVIAYEDAKPAMFPFGVQSSPTDRKLAPGVYKFWAEKNSAEVSARVIRIGEDGNSESKVDLDIP